MSHKTAVTLVGIVALLAINLFVWLPTPARSNGIITVVDLQGRQAARCVLINSNTCQIISI